MQGSHLPHTPHTTCRGFGSEGRGFEFLHPDQMTHVGTPPHVMWSGVLAVQGQRAAWPLDPQASCQVG